MSSAWPFQQDSQIQTRLLIVDDEPSILRVVERMVRGFGFACEVAPNAEEALQKIALSAPDVVLTDYKMPGLSGIDLLRKIQDQALTSGVILMTASIDIGPAIEAIKLGAYEYILKPFEPEALMMSLGRVIAKRNLLLENRRYQGYLEKTFRRYVDPSVLKVLSSFNFEAFESKKIDASILFCDIRDFTKLSGTKDVKDLIWLLNEKFFEPACAAIARNGGMIDKFTGDGVMAVFGAPVPVPDSPRQALRAATELLETLQKTRLAGEHPFRVGAGIATGQVLCGNIGSLARMDFTVMGSPVNLAARLEKLAPPDSILIDQTTRDVTNNDAEMSYAREVAIKGLEKPCTVYQLGPALAKTA